MRRGFAACLAALLGFAPPAVPAANVLPLIAALPPGASVWLAPVHTTGRINAEQRALGMARNGPQPRNYSLKWVWAADRGRALYAGGNAGAPHRLNDVWEYDLASNTWHGLWDPDPDLQHADPATLSGVFMLRDGVPMTRRGAPFDPVHTWWALAYDAQRHELIWSIGNFAKVRWSYPGDGLPYRQYLWRYAPEENRWQPLVAANPLPRTNADMLEIIPELGGLVHYANGWALRGMHVLDRSVEPPVWRNLHPNHGADFRSRDFPGPEAIGCWLGRPGVWLVQSGHATHRYTPRDNAWARIVTGAANDSPLGMDNRAAMVCAPDRQTAYLVDADPADPAGRRGRVWAFRATAPAWVRLNPVGPPPDWGMAYYDPLRKVLVVQGRGSRPWVYRP